MQVAVGVVALAAGIAMGLLSLVFVGGARDATPPQLRPSALEAAPTERPSRPLTDPVAPAYFSVFAVAAGAWALASGTRTGARSGRWLRRARLRPASSGWLVPAIAGLAGGCVQVLTAGSVLPGAVAAGAGAAVGAMGALLARRARLRVRRAAAT